jgi:hypothetical protein
MTFLKKILVAVLVALARVFCFQNLEAVSQTASFTMNFYLADLVFVTRPFPLFFLLIAAFLLGMVAAGLQSLYGSVSRSVELRRRDRRIRDLEKELEECRGRAPAALPAASGGAAPSTAPVTLEENPTL